MSVNFVKIVELLEIEHRFDQSYLHIKVAMDKQIELYWEVDSSTAGSISSVCEFGQLHKYRLSLRAKTDSASNQISSSVTKTYLNNSKRLTFACSEEFKKHLGLIKQCTSHDQLLRLPFLCKELPTITEEHVEPTEAGHSSTAAENGSPAAGEQPGNLNKVMNSSKAEPEHAIISEQPELAAPEDEAEHKKRVYTPGKMGVVASIGLLLAVIVAAVFIANQEEAVPVQKPEMKIEAYNIVNEPPSAALSNSITGEEFILFNVPENYLALTFNEGPSTYTDQIIDILNQYKVGATFFFNGSKATEDPRSVLSVQSHGYAIGSMTMTNAPIDKLSYEQQEKEIVESMEAIEKITNSKIDLFRPPGALFNQDSRKILEQLGVNVVLWNNNPHEVIHNDSAQLVAAVKNSPLSGAILYLEESREVVEALPLIIEAAQEQNLNIVNLD